MKNKWIVSVLALLLIFTTGQTSLAESNVKSMKIGISKDENTLTPYTYVTGYPGLDLVNLLYDTLFQLDEKNQPQPWLVKDYEVSEDGLTYKLTLHDNVKWQDGQPLTTEDVKFTFEYLLEHPKSRFTNPLKAISKIDVQDNTTITLTLTAAAPNFMIQPLADLPILPKHIWSEVSNPDEAQNSLGSGPYILEEYKPGQYYKMKANSNYFKGAPPAEEIIFPIIEDTTAMLTALRAGEVDAISSSISPELVEQFKSNPNLKVQNGAGFSTSMIQFNAEKYPMTEKAFRQAVAYAIDSKYLVDTVLLGYAELGSPGFIHPSSPYYNNKLSFNPDIEKAKQTLDEAGFKDTNGDGFREDPKGQKIELTTLVYSENPLRIRTAEIATEWMNDIGINVKVRAMDATTVDSLVWPDFDVAKGRDYDLTIWSWSNTMQLFPDRLIELFYSDPAVGSVNIGGYKNADFDALADKLKKTVNPDDRKQIIIDMQSLVAEEFPIIPLYYQEVVNAYNPKVYDGYVFQDGKGIINKLSFVSGTNNEDTGTTENTTNTDTGATSGETQNKSDTTNESVTDGKSGASIFILIGIIVVILGGLFILKKKSNKNNAI